MCVLSLGRVTLPEKHLSIWLTCTLSGHMVHRMTPLRLALDLALGDSATADEWLQRRTSEGASLRTIATEASNILGRPVSHNTIDNWLSDLSSEKVV